MSQEFNSQISPPLLSVASNHTLNLESTLQQLPLYSFEVDLNCSVTELMKMLYHHPLLPGVILMEKNQYAGMLSRQRILEFITLPPTKDLFLGEPINVIYTYAKTAIFQLPINTKIITAMEYILQRSPEFFHEPIVIETLDQNHKYQLLPIETLNMAAWKIQTITSQTRWESSHLKMIQNDKMASLGRLINGVVHELLDPVSFIWGNLTYVTTYTQDLLKLIKAYENNLTENNITHSNSEINAIKSEIELDFLQEDLVNTVNSIHTGAERLKKLVTSLQNFCYVDEVHPKPADLHACLDSIILLINTQIQGKIKIVKNYGYLPPVSCFIGQLNQVFINILSQLVNILMSEILEDKFKSHFKSHYSDNIDHQQIPQIRITTKVVGDNAPNSRWVAIIISNNGLGISAELQQTIRDNFSEEKTSDKETSLVMSYRIITVKHQGKFNFKSELNVGTEFEILLPL